jgi:hypothetical protein
LTGDGSNRLYTLDAAGDQVLATWLETYPDGEAIHLVITLLRMVECGEPITNRFAHGNDVASVADDHLVEVRPGLLVAIRLYSDEDPEHMYSVVRIIDDVLDDRSPDGL